MKIIETISIKITKDHIKKTVKNNPQLSHEPYDQIPESEFENHPLLGEHTMLVVESNQMVTTGEVLGYLEDNHLESATFNHLLWFPTQDYPDVPFPLAVVKEDPEFTLKNGTRAFAVFKRTPDGKGRIIHCHAIDAPWEGTNRFLALPK